MDKSRGGGGGGSTPLHLLLYSEDMRISKVLRRLVAENSPAVALDLCKKLEIAVRNQTNAAYICRSFEFLLESMVAILKQCPAECCSEQASNILGLIGYINRSEFSIYKKYIIKTYDSNRALQKYMMMALKTTISCDAVNLDLIIYSEGLITVLKDYLENAEAAYNFVAVSEAIAEFSKNYKRTFECHFTDIVDIVVGWHLEVDQAHSLKLHCSLVLQQFSQYFLKKLDFTYGLLGQFLEDIVTFGEDAAEESSPEKNRCKAEVRVGVFVGAFNSILKSLSNRTEFVCLIAASGGQEIMADALLVITKSAKQSLSIVQASEETILNINDFLSVIFLNNYYTMLQLSYIEEILELQLQQFDHFNDQQQLSLLYLILCIVRQLRTQLPCSLVNLIFKTTNNPLSSLKLTQNAKLLRLYMKLYHDVLIIKNVPLLQEAYKHIKLDIYGVIEILESGEAINVATAELTLSFYLAALSALTTQTSSIIGMYALYPSIVDLFIVHCQAVNLQLWQKHHILHNSLLSAIVVHCQKNHNYRPTSRLLRNEDIFAPDEKLSPTSENFSTILKFLAEILSKANILNIHNLNIILNWLGQLLNECKDSAGILQYNKDFVSIGKSIGIAALKSPHESARCMEILLTYTVLNPEILTCFRDVSIHLIDSVDSKIRHVYGVVFARLPLDVSLTQSCEESNALLQRESKIYGLHQWYKCTTHFSPLRQKYFKPFINRIELSTSDELSTMQNIDQFFLMLFAKCWRAQSREIALEYQMAASSSTKMLTSWLQYEVARYCVQNKLRTTMGKPQDTFLAIEGHIMKYARVLASLKNDDVGGNEVTSFNQLTLIQRNSRVLLGFLENLEKHIYSAAEGTAFASLPPELPAKTFFRINAHTCNEWFKRIRSGVNLVAMHSMEPEMVVRYSECILNTEKLSDIHMERTITSLVEALLYCGEADTLQGLYLWIKTKTSKSYTWIQHVAEQSAGHKEQAADGYAKILSEYETTMDVTLKEFLISQLLDCLYYTWQWSKMRKFLKLYESFPKKGCSDSGNISNRRSSTHLNMIETLYYGYNNASHSDEVSQALLKLSEWPTGSIELERKKCTISSFSSYSLLRKIEDSCIAQITELSNKSRLSTGMQQAIHHGLQESFRYNCNLQNNAHLQDYIILNNVFQRLCDDESYHIALEFGQTSKQSTTILTKCLLWTLLFEQRANRNGHTDGFNKQHALYLDISASARREGNLNLCRTMLERFFVAKGFAEPSLLSISKNMQNNIYTIDIEDSELLSGFREVAKYLYVHTAGHQIEAIHLGAAYCCQILQLVCQFPQLHYPEAIANMLLTIADWLMQRGSSSMMESPQLQQLLSQLPDVPEVHLSCDNTSSIIPSTEKAVGKLINAATIQQNDTGESWCTFGNWCYRWGKKIVEANTSEKYSNRLSQHDLMAIKAVVGGEALDAEAITQLVSVLNSHRLNVCDGVEDIDSNEVISIDFIENDIRKISIFANKPVEQITAIVEIWRKAHRSIYIYYEMAAKAYFKYLSIETVHSEVSHKGSNAGDSTFVTVTLRLLRLVVKHAIGLQEVLEEGIRTTPLRPWKVIIPQLFSRLNHHEPYVRKSVSELLCRLARDRPHLIIFPAVVGAHQELKAELPLCDEQRTTAVDNNFYIPNQNKTAAALSTCFSSLLMTLSKQMPETVLHVQLLVKELKRITLLWEEYWLHALAQLHAEYSTLFSELEIESKNCLPSHAVQMKLKYDILLNYVVIDLQRIATVTEKPAETNYERTFQDRYNPYIKNTIDELKMPFNVNNVGKSNDNWIKIKQLYNLFQQRSMRGSASTLKISDLSPVLASMKDTSISMLGVDTFEKNPIHIKSVDNTVYILPTKTRPKKLSFSGSDGRKYTYLFKGLEDLHLDERIMQFLSISNSMMERSKDSLTANANLFKAQHYSVIPLGTQSGLISWVDGVTPLFAIYKKWQQRDIALKQQQNERPSNVAVYKNVQQLSIVPATRPSDIFYNKLTPLLAEQNLKVTDPRKQWPLPVLRRVLEELTKDTPKYLLAKELWCHATNAADWRKSVRNYSVSVAVMSVIGYIIGLGDRHLDNVLIKLSTGEIVHIDYNVCFEKGKTLRVPEKVPFRMTPNLEEALGITGIEGTFRLGCEHVLKTLRKERETLLTLLEAFVYDPLVDWTISGDGTTTTAARYTSAYTAATSIAAITNHNILNTADMSKSSTTMRFNNLDDLGHRKHQGGSEFSRQTMEIRFNEMKPYWTHYKNELTLKLTNIGSEIKLLLNKREAILQAEQERNHLTKQLAMIRELEALGSAMGSHALNTITQRYTTYKKNVADFDAAKWNICKYHSDIKTLLERYFDHLMVPSLVFDLTCAKRQLYDQQQQQEILISANEFDVIHDFLSERSSESLYKECVFARNEMNKTLIKKSNSVSECLELLLQYASIMQYYSRSCLQQNKLVRFERWYQQLLVDDDIEGDNQRDVAPLRNDVDNFLEEETLTRAGTNLEKSLALQYSAAIEKIWIELNFDLHKAINYFNELKQLTTVVPFEVTVSAIQNFVATGSQHHNENILQRCMLRLLSKANNNFLLYEDTALDESDALLLERQMDYIDLTLGMCRIVFPSATDNGDVFAALELLHSTLFSLRKLKSAFEFPLVERIVRLFMLDTDLELQSYLDIMCTTPAPTSSSPSNFTKLKQFPSRENSTKDEFFALLAELYGVFDEFEVQLDKLQKIASDILEQMSHLGCKEFMQSKTFRRILNSLSSNDLKCNAISEIFCIVRKHVGSLNSNNLQTIYDIRLISTPVTHYINQLQRSSLGGLTSLFAHILYTTVHSFHSTSVTSDADVVDDDADALSQSLCQNLLMTLQHNCNLKNQQLQVWLNTKWVEHYTLVASSHFWINEPMLSSDVHLMYGHIVYKDKLLNSLQSAMQSLSTWKHSIAKMQSVLDGHTATVREHLKWSVDGNQNINDSFMEYVNLQNQQYGFYLHLSTQLLEKSEILLQFEMWTAREEAQEEGSGTVNSLDIVRQWKYANEQLRQSAAAITSVEQAIVQLLDPEDKIDQCWIANISGLLDEITFSVQRRLAGLEYEEQTIQDNLYAEGQQLQLLIDTPMRMRIRHLLKMISKSDKKPISDLKNETFFPVLASPVHVRDLQHLFKLFYANLGELQLQLITRDFDLKTTLLELNTKISDLLCAVEQNETELFQLMQLLVQNTNNNKSITSTTFSPNGNSANNSNFSDNHGATTSGDTDKKVVSQCEQKRNVYAVSVWKRIRMKLEGRDPDTNRRSTVAEQVHFIIREAINPDNLAVLYEGWTPWV